MREYNIALVGKTGHGKSSTGNTILQKMSFEESFNADDGTEILDLKRGSMDKNIKFKVYDIPGILSLRHEKENSKGALRKEFDRLMDVAVEIHIFVLVLNFNCRFTKEEDLAVNELKLILGKDFLKEHGIIVVTHGDNCDTKALELNKRTQDIFKEWCLHGGDNFRTLQSEVGSNIIIVNNKGDFSETSKRIESSNNLRKMIQNMPNLDSPFTKAQYDKLKPKCDIL